MTSYWQTGSILPRPSCNILLAVWRHLTKAWCNILFAILRHFTKDVIWHSFGKLMEILCQGHHVTSFWQFGSNCQFGDTLPRTSYDILSLYQGHHCDILFCNLEAFYQGHYVTSYWQLGGTLPRTSCNSILANERHFTKTIMWHPKSRECIQSEYCRNPNDKSCWWKNTCVCRSCLLKPFSWSRATLLSSPLLCDF